MFDPTKPVQMKTGGPARIIYTDRPGDLPIIALVGPRQYPYVFDAEGYSWEAADSLVNIPEKTTKYVLLSRNRMGGQLSSAARSTPDKRYLEDVGLKVIGTIQIDYEDGEPVSVKLMKED